MFWLKLVRIYGLPSGPKLFCGVASVKGVGTLYESPLVARSPQPERPFSKENRRVGGVYATIFVNGTRPEGQGRATPPHRQNYLSAALLGNGLQVHTRESRNFTPNSPKGASSRP